MGLGGGGAGPLGKLDLFSLDMSSRSGEGKVARQGRWFFQGPVQQPDLFVAAVGEVACLLFRDLAIGLVM